MSTTMPGMDMEEIRKLMEMYGPSEADKGAAKWQGLLAAGLGLLGARKGQEGQAFGNAGLLGLQARDQALNQSTLQRGAGLNQALNAMQLKQHLDSQSSAARTGQAMGNIFSGAPSGPQLQNMGPGGPTPQNAQAIAPPIVDRIAKYRAAADYHASQNNPKVAKEYADMADKLEEEYSQTPQVMMQGDKAVNALISKRGNIKTLDGFAPPPKFREVNLGGTTSVVNDYNIPASGQSFAHTFTPEGASNAANQAAHLKIAQAAEARAAGGGEQKPQLVGGQWVYPPSAASPTGRAVTPAGLVAPDKPLTESQAKATAYLNNMQNASKTLSDLSESGFTGKSAMQQAGIVNAQGEGIPYVPGTGIIQRAMSSDEAQKFHQAELQWTEQNLRFMTGANAPETEVKRAAATYFPRPGDSPAVIEQKAAARAKAEESIAMAAGAGVKKVAAQEEKPKPQKPNAGKVIRYDTKGRRIEE